MNSLADVYVHFSVRPADRDGYEVYHTKTDEAVSWHPDIRDAQRKADMLNDALMPRYSVLVKEETLDNPETPVTYMVHDHAQGIAAHETTDKDIAFRMRDAMNRGRRAVPAVIPDDCVRAGQVRGRTSDKQRVWVLAVDGKFATVRFLPENGRDVDTELLIASVAVTYPVVVEERFESATLNIA